MYFQDDFEGETDNQKERDTNFMRSTRMRYVAPLVLRLEAAIPHYSSMGAYERFIALMQLNEEHAPHGHGLMLDFGTVAGGVENGANVVHANMRSRGIVFSGRSGDGYMVEERNGVNVYMPRVSDNVRLGVDPFSSPVDGAMLEDDALPLPYRVALLALYVRQNVFTSLVDSCRFASGMPYDYTRHRRWFLDGVESGEGQLFGWCTFIRDTTPPNKLLLHIAGKMRGFAKSRASVQGSLQDSRPVAEVGEDVKQRRTLRQSTETLVWFVDEHLPDTGFHVGRSGVGKQISWKSAHALFEDSHPGMYKSPTSFRNAYYNAKKARKERHNGTV